MSLTPSIPVSAAAFTLFDVALNWNRSSASFQGLIPPLLFTCLQVCRAQRSAGVCLIISLCLSSSLQHWNGGRGGNYKCNNLETRSPSSYYVWAKTRAKNSASGTKCQNENLPLMYTHILEDKRNHFTSWREVTYWHYTSCKWGMLTTEKKLN